MILSDMRLQSYAGYCKASLKARSVSSFQLLYNKKESLGNSLYELVFYESGRQVSNLRPSAPKTPQKSSTALGFQAISNFLRSIKQVVQLNQATFFHNLSIFLKVEALELFFMQVVSVSIYSTGVSE